METIPQLAHDIPRIVIHSPRKWVLVNCKEIWEYGELLYFFTLSPLFSLAALFLWTLFAEGMTQSTLNIVSNANIIIEVIFNRLFMLIANILSLACGVFDFRRIEQYITDVV